METREKQSKMYIQDKYISDLKAQLEIMHPEWDEDIVTKYLKIIVKSRFKDYDCSIFNNYTNVKQNTTLAGFVNWYKKKNPITTERGVMFKRHDEGKNNGVALLSYLLDARKKEKSEMFKYPKGSDNYNFHDIRQRVYKILVNSYYGVSGQAQSVFYNLFVAFSITGKGQSIIATAMTTFERFLSNNIHFCNDIECMDFIYNTINEEYNILDSINNIKSKDEVLNYLIEQFENPVKAKDLYYNQLNTVLSNLSEEDLNKIYYKNNLFEFFSNDIPMELIRTIVNKCNNFLDPNEIPEEIKDDLDELWSLVKDNVFYNYVTVEKIHRIKENKRKSVITVDTDSNFLNIDPWVKFIKKNINIDMNEDKNRFTTINIMAYLLTNIIKESFWLYTGNCNVPENKRGLIRMKNEFLFKRILLTEKKKAYASILELQEGNIIDPPKLDIKGLTIKKSNVNEYVGDALQSVLEKKILRANPIRLEAVLQSLEEIKRMLTESFSKGELKYSKPEKVNDIESYKTPYQISAVRGLYAYEVLELGEVISTPAQVNTIKLKGSTINDIAYLYKDYPDIYTEIKNNIFDNDNKSISNGGFTVLTVPKSMDKLPDWLIPLIDVETIVDDNMRNTLIFLESIGLRKISKTVDNTTYSNIIDF